MKKEKRICNIITKAVGAALAVTVVAYSSWGAEDRSASANTLDAPGGK